MHSITNPIKTDNKEAVTNLQAALVFLLSNQSLQLTADALTALQKLWQQEQQEASYAEATTKLVAAFQQQYGVADNSGKVDEETATKLNELLKGLGAFKIGMRSTVFDADGKYDCVMMIDTLISCDFMLIVAPCW